LKLGGAKLSKSLFELNDKTFYMNSSVMLEDGRIAFEGKIDSKNIAIIVSAEKVDLGKFDSFSFLKMKGSSGFNIAFTGSPEDTSMDATFKYNNYSIEDFYLGEGRAHILFNFKNMQTPVYILNKNAKREQGKKAQAANIKAAMVSYN